MSSLNSLVKAEHKYKTSCSYYRQESFILPQSCYRDADAHTLENKVYDIILVRHLDYIYYCMLHGRKKCYSKTIQFGTKW